MHHKYVLSRKRKVKVKRKESCDSDSNRNKTKLKSRWKLKQIKVIQKRLMVSKVSKKKTSFNQRSLRNMMMNLKKRKNYQVQIK